MWAIPDEIFDGKLTFRNILNYNRYNDIYDAAEEEFDDYVSKREWELKRGAKGPIEFHRKDGSSMNTSA